MPETEDKGKAADQTAGEPTPSSTVTDDELARAWEAATTEDTSEEASTEAPKEEPKQEGETEETKGKEEKPSGEEAAQTAEGEGEKEPPADTDETPKGDPEEHKERTKLGRKVAKLEDTLSQVLEQNRILLEKLTSGTPQPAEPSEAQEEEYLDLSNPETLRKFLANEEHRRASQAQPETGQYQSGYLTSLQTWQKSATEGEEYDPEDVKEINKLLTDTKSPFNVKRSANPSTDFDVNLAKATAHHYKAKATAKPAKENPLEKNREGKPKAPLGVGGESKTEVPKAAKPVELDEYSKAMVKRYGWSEEEVAKALASGTRR